MDFASESNRVRKRGILSICEDGFVMGEPFFRRTSL